MATPVGDSIPVLVTGNNNNGTLTEEFISGLVQGSAWLVEGPRTITYSLDLNFDGPTQAWTLQWSDAIAGALSAWSAVANVNFALAGTPGGQAQNASAADIAIALAPGFGEGFVLGLGVFPDPEFVDLVLQETGYTRDIYPRLEGDIVFDSAHPALQSVLPGTQGFEVLMHEIGHALGLKHPDDDGGNGRPTFSSLGIADYDLPMHTLMTTLDASNGTTPGPLDILAIQHIYGANMTYHAGDDVYVIAGEETGHRTIWDAGGNDTFDASQQPYGVTVDLRPGSYSVGSTAIAYNVTIENAIGGAGDDRMTGNDAANNLSGGAGPDWLDGGPGADTLIGGIGDDTYVAEAADVLVEAAGEGTDTIRSLVTRSLAATFENLVLLGAANLKGSGNGLANSITGNSGNNVLNGGGGNDTLAGSAGRDTLVGGAGNDVYANPGGDVVTEAVGGGMDQVRSSTNATLPANVESLILTGNSDSNTSGAGNVLANRLQGNDGRNRLDGGGGNDTIIGGGGNDTINGGMGNDSLVGGAGSNTLNGGAGDDTLDGSLGNDSLSGGAGNDRYRRVSASDVVIEAPGEGVDTVESSSTTTLGANVENLLLTFSYESIGGTGNGLANRLDGNGASNRLDGADGNDTLVGNEGFDTLIGGDGDDVLTGGYDNDMLNGGDGNDTLVGGPEVAGFDNDTLIGGAGDDVMSGRGFDDFYIVDSAGDVVIELAGGGTDTVQSSITYALAANVEHLILTGGGDFAGTGNSRGNRITGNAGANLLDGGAGIDTLVGGAGNDTYVLDDAAPTTYFSFSGESGDYISQGRSYFVGFDDGPFFINATDGNLDDLVDTVTVYTNSLAPELGLFWLLSFSTRYTGLPMQAGTFLDAVRYPGDPAGQPGLDISGDGRGSNTLTGQFTVTEAVFDYSGVSPEVVRFAVSYEQHSEGSEPALTGKLVINGPVVAGDAVIEMAGGGTDTVETSHSYTLAANVENLLLTGTGSVNGTGNGGNNVIRGNAANNVLTGAGGADSLKGMGGLDTLVWDSADVLIDGGPGADTLRVNGGNLDLTAVGNGKIIDVETIDLTGGGGNALTLDGQDVLDLSSTTDALRVLGDVADSIDIVGAFIDLGVSGGFHRYTFGGATLLVETDITNVA